MDFSGLVGKFPVNRPLTQDDVRYQLQQSTRLDMEPRDMLAVIKMNSTFLESVDKWFAFRGFPTVVAISCFLVFAIPFGYITFHSLLTALGFVETHKSREEYAILAAFVGTLLVLFSWGMFALMKKESFAYTHYPIRLNRKTRTVHYFRTNGQVASVRWDDVFFTLGQSSLLWGVRGHVLADDKVTVLDTFGLSRIGVISSHDPDPVTGQFEKSDYVRSHWEFIRRYMEEGPQELVQGIQICLPISDRKETLKGGIQRILANFSGDSVLTTLIMSPLYAWLLIGRRIAVLTSKIPQWPAEIDAVCCVERGDPFAIKGDSDGDRIPDASYA